ncbi:Ubiquitin domain-containing protein DSK2b [Ananas comosus]|uniref:Ubiquitin domain-containing protein DSK2b n=1 Tax=Ananas comosus TaxID=4615 RepID=A0A199UL45_ANACO|nr:Ubiquitin domain-containing protein DSK2b [Ananas comosus]
MGSDGDSGDAGGAGGEGAAAAAVTVHIRCSNGSKFSVQVDLEATVGAFKAVVAGSCDVPAEQQRLIYKGRILKDDQTLASYGVESDHTIHLVRGAAPSSTPAPTTTTNQGASRTPNSSPPGGGSGSLFPGLGGMSGTGASGLFGSGFPDLEQMQQQLTQNPNMMREIMNTPIIQSLLNNPDIMRNIIMNNPQMREIIDRNPDLAHILNDPTTLRQTLEAARNPELMREMMRNTDRAMSNIESSPEGFNMLRRMYETVQEPFLNATTMAGEGDIGSNPFAALLGNQGATQTRDQSANHPANNTEATTGSPAPNTNPLPNPWSTNAGGAQPGSTRPSPAGGARATGAAGLGGLGLPNLESMTGGMDSSLLSQAIQNPAMLQMMQNILTDPQAMNRQNPAMLQMMQNILTDPQALNRLISMSPNMRNILDSSTELREMFQNPEFLRQLMSPETLQQMLSIQQSFFTQLGRQQSSQEQNQSGGGTGTQLNSSMEFLMNMFNAFGAEGLNVPNTSNVPPEELYATQLSQLQEMGFVDTQENIRALTATSGNVHAAVERLLGNLG